MAKKVTKTTNTPDDNVLGMLSHLLGIFTSFIGPLVMYIVTTESKGKAYENAKHALNFQISLLIYYFISFILVFILIGVLLMWALGIFSLVVGILGTIRAYQGEIYQYPLEIKFIK